MKTLSLFCIVLSLTVLASCGDDDPAPQPTVATITVTVQDSGSSQTVSGANVILYNSSTGDAIRQALTGSNGQCSFTVDLGGAAFGTFALRVSAQGYAPSPTASANPVPFQANAGQTAQRSVSLTPSTLTDAGSISGKVEPAVDNMLVVATLTNDATVGYQSVTGPDGSFVIFNLPYGSYSLKAIKKGYACTSSPVVTISSSVKSGNATIPVTTAAGATMSGSLAINTTAGVILPEYMDVTLLDPATMLPIPGLSVKALQASNWAYTMTGIPAGTYKAWATFGNDNLVMDPDWVRKNPGILDVSLTNLQSLVKNFNTTPSFVTITPSNPLTNLEPAKITNLTPTFQWKQPSTASSANYLVIEVRDADGATIWGGFANNSLNPTNNLQIPKGDGSILFNSDGKALKALEIGKTYQWKMYAVNSKDSILLSVSEDQQGLFTIVAP